MEQFGNNLIHVGVCASCNQGVLSPVAVYIQGILGLFLGNKSLSLTWLRRVTLTQGGGQTSAGKYNLTCSYLLFVIFGSGPNSLD